MIVNKIVNINDRGLWENKRERLCDAREHVCDFDINTFKITAIYVRFFRSPVQSVPFQ